MSAAAAAVSRVHRWWCFYSPRFVKQNCRTSSDRENVSWKTWTWNKCVCVWLWASVVPRICMCVLVFFQRRIIKTKASKTIPYRYNILRETDFTHVSELAWFQVILRCSQFVLFACATPCVRVDDFFIWCFGKYLTIAWFVCYTIMFAVFKVNFFDTKNSSKY